MLFPGRGTSLTHLPNSNETLLTGEDIHTAAESYAVQLP